jgi:sigma-B regulation protein RsbU (phosphoserine phosphatase)
MKKPKRFPLAVKVNVVIMTLVLCVSVLLTLISENAYQEAVFRPYFRKLQTMEIPEDEMKLILQGFGKYFGLEEMDRAREEGDREDDMNRLAVWLIAQPSWRGASDSLLHDWIEFEAMLSEIQRKSDLHEVSCFEEKNGSKYSVCTVLDNEENVTFSIRDFGRKISEDSPATEAFLSPKYFKEDDRMMLTRCMPIRLENGDEALLWLKYDLTDEIREHGHFLLRCVLLTLGVTLLASVVTALVMRRFVLRPVRSLAQATKEFVPEEDGIYSPEKISRVDIRNRDEIGDLSRDIRTMQESIVTNTENLARMTAEKERVSTELELAAQIQADALPNVFPAFPEHAEFGIFASMTPAKEVGGDFYDFFLIDETHLGLVMADVSGKGVPAALFMMNAKSLVRMYAKTGMGPAQVMQAVNDWICENNRLNMFVTVWFGILDLSAGRITAVNAGHEYPALMPADGRFDLIREKSGFVVGGMAGLRYREQEILLTPGAKIFLYTDGVPEANNAAGEMFGEQRMLSALNEGRGNSPEGILLHMKKAVDAFAQDTAQFDDMTMLCLEYRGPAVS